MGAEGSKGGGGTLSSRSTSCTSSGAIDYPNLCRKESEATAWTLLHQCTLDRWKDGHAEAAGFSDAQLTCDGVLHKDCSFSFCMSRQGIININRSSIFSFRKRSKFAKMAEHFEYNHIPAQMSSINHFRVRGVLCFDDTLVVLHLSRNTNTQFGLLDLRANKFLGVFGKQPVDLSNDSLAGELSPDRTKCLVWMSLVEPDVPAVTPLRSTLHLYELRTATLLREVMLDRPGACHFAFDPRFAWHRIAVTNYEGGVNALSTVDTSTWEAVATNTHASDTHPTLYPYLRDLRYTRSGSLLVATILDRTCYCREKRTARNYRPVGASLYVFDGDAAVTLHCITYRRFTCSIHSCLVNYKPVFSACGSRMAVAMNVADAPTVHYVQVYKLPSSATPGGVSLQALCRVVILQTYAAHSLAGLPLPVKLINYLHFKPEFDAGHWQQPIASTSRAAR